MNIVVTIPKKEFKNIQLEDKWAESKSDVIQYWAIKKKPINLNVGDRVYFVADGYIRYYHKFLGYVENPTCQVTGRVWHGLNMILEYPEIKCDLVPMKGFQGFRYIQNPEKET